MQTAPCLMRVPSRYKIEELDGYQTHAPVLERLLEIFRPKDILEFGPGKFSTKLFLDSAPQDGTLVSVEMQSEQWAGIVQGLFKGDPRFTLHSALGADTWQGLPLNYHVDFAFVDGHGESRPEVINYLSHIGVPVIVTHDTEHQNYGWHRIQGNPNYTHWTYRDALPWTDTFIRNDALWRVLSRTTSSLGQLL